ncbi:MAG: hypothetical protein PHC54_03205 [Candidatus Omnitrophica bacterium]|nr:hypothetical protein [Candidatus Omnitrophota bacterium]MDD5592443.1 hypothetical protein [Candidatus Omnitrophota bacterium]
MNKNDKDKTIWCHICFTWVCALAGVLRLSRNEGRDDILCLNCEAHLGYDTDWPELYR